MARNPGSGVGFGRSDVQTFTIPSGADGSAVAAIDFGRGYAAFVVKCEDCAGLPDAATLKALVGYDGADTLCDLYTSNDPGLQWIKDTPTSGTLAFLLSHAFGAQRLRFVASAVTTQDVVIKVYGLDPTVDD